MSWGGEPHRSSTGYWEMKDAVTEAESPLELMERFLSLHSILRDQERDNVRAKAADLLEERSVWESTPLRLQIEPNRRCQLSAECR